MCRFVRATGYLTLGFLAFVLITMGFSEIGRWVLASTLILIPLLIGGWYLTRNRITQAATQREGHTGTHPVIAARPTPTKPK